MPLFIYSPWPELPVFSGATLLATRHCAGKGATLLALQMAGLANAMLGPVAECRKTLHSSFCFMAFPFFQEDYTATENVLF